MKKFFGNKPVLIMVIAEHHQQVLAFFSAGSRTIPWVESAVGAVIRPIQTFAFKASNSISDFFSNLFNTTDADIENASLKQKLALYEQEKLDYDELLKENERLRAMLGYAGTFTFEMVYGCFPDELVTDYARFLHKTGVYMTRTLR